ncbi:MAG: DUF5716 family protein, partial [Lachnospiraceae bacterium]|nr:DUF5716 family protein [Lachnospiraceae bacterium]
MILKERIPRDFYKLFRTKNAGSYMEILVSIYEENNEVYAALGLTSEECLAIINENLAKAGFCWEADNEDGKAEEELSRGESQERPNAQGGRGTRERQERPNAQESQSSGESQESPNAQESRGTRESQESPNTQESPNAQESRGTRDAACHREISAVTILGRLTEWGWLKSDYDEKMNSYVISFPEYSQLFTELFQRLQKEDDGAEREGILSIYSALFTFHADPERNNDILKNALLTSKRLGQLLSNLQDG